MMNAYKSLDQKKNFTSQIRDAPGPQFVNLAVIPLQIGQMLSVQVQLKILVLFHSSREDRDWLP